MKVPASVRALFDAQRDANEKLREAVKDLLKPQLQPYWHYVDRVKTEESFALKIESGRFGDPARLEDFFACTIVVRNHSEIPEAEKLVLGIFSLHERRPPSSVRTKKYSSSFDFDDLRLYVKYKEDPALPPKGLKDIPFEIQVKTFLQHAWSIATHDLIYKTDSVSWPKERIAFQVRAMLEHVEISITEAEQLASSHSIPQEQVQAIELNKIVGIVREFWHADDLPKNLVGLARNVEALISNLEIGSGALRDLIKAETDAGRGASLRNLSPYLTIVASIVAQRRQSVEEFLRRQSLPRQNSKFRLIVPSELTIPTIPDMKPGRIINIG